MITIVTVNYNSKSDLEKTLNTIGNQSGNNIIEVIVVDGGSSDGSQSIVKEKFNKIVDILISENDAGIYDAMNKGIKAATGEWINFMNAGDVFYRNTTLSEVFKHHIPQLTGVIYGDTYTIKGLFKMTPFFERKEKLKGMGISHQSLFVRVDLANKLMFNLEFKIAADYNMIMKIFNLGYNFFYVKMPISLYDLYGYSSHNVIRQFYETAKICKVKRGFSFYLTCIKIKSRIILRKLLNR